jgi:hypothetical protein
MILIYLAFYPNYLAAVMKLDFKSNPLLCLNKLLARIKNVRLTEVTLFPKVYYKSISEKVNNMSTIDHATDPVNITGYTEFVFYRIPKNNHESLLQVTTRLKEYIQKENVTYDCFSLISTENIPGFVNVTKIIPINTDEEEIWINMVTYKDRHHRLDVVEKISKNRECLDIYEELMKLLTPGTGFINGEFKNLFNN